MTLLEDGISAHFDRVKDAAGVSITYSRNADAVTLTAVPGETTFEATDQTGAVVQVISQDFIFEQSDLVLNGTTVTPQRNDKITRTVNGATRTYRLLMDFGLPHYRETDAHGHGFRVFTKEV